MSIVVNKTRLPVTQWQTESGSVVSISDARKRYAKSLSVALEPIQDLHGYANPWVGGAGSNIFDASAVYDTINKYVKASDGKLESPSGSVVWRYTPYTPVTEGTQLYFGEVNASASTAGTAFYSYANEASFISGVSATGLASANNVLTVPTGAKYMRHSFRVDAGYNENWQTTVYICKNSDPHVWTPYANLCPISGRSSVTAYRAGVNQSDNPQSVTVQLGQTVFGGSVDLVSGVMAVDTYAYDLANYTGTVTVVGNNEKRYFRFDSLPIYPIESAYCISDKYVEADITSSTTVVGVKNGKASGLSHRSIFFRPENPANYNATTIKSFITDTLGGLTVCYKIDPIIIQLTPTQIEMLMRNNTVWSDAGVVTLNYARIRQ